LYFTANSILLLKRKRLYNIYTFLGYIGSTDFITYYLRKMFNKLDLSRYHLDTIINYIFYRKQRFGKIILISPLIFILYDCIFNHWILIYTYYYLLLYIPLMLFKRITTHMGSEAAYIRDLLWHIYYEKDKNFTQFEGILDIYLLNGLRRVSDIDIGFEMYLKYITLFVIHNPERNTYINDEGTYLTLRDNKVYEEIESQYETGNMIEVFGTKIPEREIRYTLGRICILAKKAFKE